MWEIRIPEFIFKPIGTSEQKRLLEKKLKK